MAPVDPQVGDHAALRCQIRRVHALSDPEGGDVVADQRLEEGHRVRAVEPETPAVLACRPAGAGGDDAILRAYVAHPGPRWPS